jgi:2-isopropylmalate synthase
MLDGMQVSCGTMGMPTATVRLRNADGAVFTQAAIGTGPVDAAYKAMDAIIQAPNTLLEFSVHSVTEGIDALGEVTVRIQGKNGNLTLDAQKEIEQSRTFGGFGADTDIVVASAKAYLSALNKLLLTKQQASLQSELGNPVAECLEEVIEEA